MTLAEKQEACGKIFIVWTVMEKRGDNMAVHDEDMNGLFTARMISRKFETFDVDIVLPDMLLMMLDLCVSGNPGMFQIVLKDLLNSIKQRKGPIPNGYIITSEDFAMCFVDSFPILDIKKVEEKYTKMWQEQKRETEAWGTDNLCDTKEWWKEVII